MDHRRQPHLTLKRILKGPLLALAIVVVIVDDAFRAVVVPAVRRLARIDVMRRLEALIARLPPYGILTLFLVPLAIIEPFKIYGLYLMGLGHVGAGLFVFALAKVIGVGLAERLFAIGRGKLLSIRWFAWCFAKSLAIRDFVHERLMRTKFWRQARMIVARIRHNLAAAKASFARWRAANGRGRFAAARRRVRRLLASS
ncbi:hypothetical protein [Microvirga flavescens]|uniref:hypothetical protein n=1 Tax=Microvirga flavescens TaxID=2249811 RepID=UPI001300503D|nr:hypothetical protein [Microvirga flavescens]